MSVQEMTPGAFRKALKAFGLDQTTAAEFLSLSRRTVHNWSNGHGSIHPAVVKLFVIMLVMDLTPKQADKLIAKYLKNHKNGS